MSSLLATTSTMEISAATSDQANVASAKPNQNTVVVISESTARRPAAEARKRRKEILNKQHKLPLRAEGEAPSASIQLTENLVAVAAAAAAAGLDLGTSATTSPLEDAVVVPAPGVDDPSSLDIPFLDDAAIAATAAAVAMNSNQNELGGENKRSEKNIRKPVAARKHPRVETDDDDASDDDETDEMKRNKKTQIRYDPSIPMEKEQLAAWRREARRVRNRESAAASRQRIRGRITELEDEINDWKQKYHEAALQLAQVKGATTTGEPETQV
jgi:hypothetical protein